MGKIIPGVNDRRSSGMFSGDFSDVSSISSTGSGSRFKKLRDTTDMARASLDSLRRGSKESLDELFKRGFSITGSRTGNDEMSVVDRKRASTGDMNRLSQKLGFATNHLAQKVKRTSSLRSQQQPTIEDQIHRDWLLANQLSATENTYHKRQNSISSNHSTTSNRLSTGTATTVAGGFMNRFSQLVSSKPVTPFQSSQGQSQAHPSQRNDTKGAGLNRDIGRTTQQQAYRGFV